MRPKRHPSPAGAAALLYGGALGLPAIILSAALLQTRYPIGNLLRDPLVLAREAASVAECCAGHYGVISNLGVLLWLSTAAVCLFASLLLARGGERADALFLLLAGTVSAALGTDDWLMLHESALPRLGVSEIATLAAHAGLGVVYVVVCHRRILEHHAGLFLLAGCFLAASVLSDFLPVGYLPIPAVIVEDGAKLFGIFCWTFFHVSAASSRIGRTMKRADWDRDP